MSDYLGPERSEEFSSRLADSWREALGVKAEKAPNVLWCVEDTFSRIFPQFALVLRPDVEMGRAFAVAENNPPRIEIRTSAYAAVEQGHPRAREILMHEFAHVVTQNQAVPKFYLDGEQARSRIKRMSLEHLADEFAQHFLAPAQIVSKMSSIGEIMRECGVTFSLAVKAGLSVGIRPRRALQPYERMAIEAEETDDFSAYRAANRNVPRV